MEHVLGAESRSETGEPHAAEQADPLDQQAITVCFAIEHFPARTTRIDKPRQYEHWRDFQPPGGRAGCSAGPPSARKPIEPLTRFLFEADGRSSVVAVPPHPRPRKLRGRLRPQRRHRRELAPERLLVRPRRRRRRRPSAPATSRPRGSSASACSTGFRPRRRDRTAARATLACACAATSWAARPTGWRSAPYVRESRRLRAEFTVLEQHIAYPLRPDGPELFADSRRESAATGSTCIPGQRSRLLDLGCWPFQIPLGAMIPRAGREPAPRRQEPRRDAHHQRGVPRSSGRMEHRRGGRASWPRSAWNGSVTRPRSVRNRRSFSRSFRLAGQAGHRALLAIATASMR